jgi:hypothetical protein
MRTTCQQYIKIILASRAKPEQHFDRRPSKKISRYDHTAVKDFALVRGSLVSWFDMLLLLPILWVLIHPSGLERVQQIKAKA